MLALANDPRLTLEINRFNLEINAAKTPLAGRPFTALREDLDDALRVVREKRPGTQVFFASTCSRYESGLSTGTGPALARQRWSFQIVRRTLNGKHGYGALGVIGP